MPHEPSVGRRIVRAVANPRVIGAGRLARVATRARAGLATATARLRIRHDHV
jgi:hypothetical protein